MGYLNGTLLFLGLSGGELLVILLAIVVLFGAKSLPEIARGLGKGLNEFKKAAEEIKKEVHQNSSGIMNEINDVTNDIKKEIQDID